MKLLAVPVIFLVIIQLCEGGPLRLQKRAAFYIANETACVVDNTVYFSGDPIPTDDPCEACKCRPPGFACVLKECENKPGCRAVRRAGHCCPEYICDSDNSSNLETDFHPERTFIHEETTVSSLISDTTHGSELPINPSSQAADEELPQPIQPEISDPVLLLSATEDQDTNSNIHSTKNDVTTQSVPEIGSNEGISLDAESNEENAPEKVVENATELLKSDFEIVTDSEKHEEPESSADQSPTESIVGPGTSVIPNANDELFPAIDTTVKYDEIKADTTVKNDEIKADKTTERSVLTTLPNTEKLSDAIEELDDKANELIKKFRSLENATSEEETKTEKDNEDDVEIEETKVVTVSDGSSTTQSVGDLDVASITERLMTVNSEKDSPVENLNLKDEESSEGDRATTETAAKLDSLYYNSEEKEEAVSESVETVTFTIHVKEQSSSEEVSAEDEKLLGTLDSATEELDEKEASPQKDENSASSTLKGEEEVSTIFTPETGSEEKIQLYSADDIKTVASTENKKMTDIEISTTEAVDTVSSQEVEQPVKE